MKKKTKLFSLLALLCAGCLSAAPAGQQGNTNDAPKQRSLKVCVVNFKLCVEQSKMGKQEASNFEQLKKQMESVVVEKEKSLNELAAKLEDPDYLDSLSPEAETDLKRKFRMQGQELQQLQQQYMQTLNQTHFKALQKLNDSVSKAADEIAKGEGYDLVLNEEGTYFYGPNLDISKKVITMLDEQFEKEQRENKDKK